MGATGSGRPRLRFGVFELDLDGGQLLRCGTVLPVQQQPLRLIAHLAARSGEVVGRDELRQTLWPEGVHVDFERSLNFCVSRARRVLGDRAPAPVYIETVPHRGYRFVAPVSLVPVPPGVRPAHEGMAGRVLPRVALLALVVGLASQSPPPIGLPPTASPPRAAAQEAWRRGAYHARLSGHAAESTAAFLEAVMADDHFAAAHSGLAQSYVRQVEQGTLSPGEGMPLARAAAIRALALRDDASAHLALAGVALRYDWSIRAAEREVGDALALDPASAAAYSALADVELAAGRPAAALAAARRAEELDPTCPTIPGLVAQSYYAAHRFEEAADAWRRAARFDQTVIGPHERMFHAYRHAGRFDDAVREASAVLAILGRPSALERTPPAVAVASFLRGSITYLTRNAPRSPALVGDRIAALHAALGERDEAMLWIDRAARERAPELPIAVASDPDLDAVRDAPAVQALLHRLASS